MRTLVRHFAPLVVLACALSMGWMLGFATYDLAPDDLVRVSAWTSDWVGALGQWAGAIGGLMAAFFAARAWRAASATLAVERGRDKSADDRDLRSVLAWTIEPTGTVGTANDGEGGSYRWVAFRVGIKNTGRAPLYDLRVGLGHRAAPLEVSEYDVARIDLLLPGASEQRELSWRGAQQLLGDSDQTISPAVSFTDVEEGRWTHIRGRLFEGDLVPDEI